MHRFALVFAVLLTSFVAYLQSSQAQVANSLLARGEQTPVTADTAVSEADVSDTDWPGWRADGSGVSPTGGLPLKWSNTENVRWKTKIPGVGHSSPIVSNGRVFLTTSSEAPARFAQVRQVSLWGANAVTMVLALVALLWSVDTTFRYPGSRYRLYDGTQPFSWGAYVGSKLTKSIVFLIATYGTLRVFQEIETAAPALPLLGSPEIWNHTASLFEGMSNGKVPWALSGVVGGLTVLLVNAYLDFHRKKTVEGIKSWLGGSDRNLVVHSLEAAFVLLVTGCFLGLVGMTLALEFPEHPNGFYSAEWVHFSMIAATGFMTAIGSFRVASVWKLLVAAIAGVMLAVYLVGPPIQPGYWSLEYYRDRNALYYLLTLVTIAWFCIQYIRYRRNRDYSAKATSMLALSGPISFILIAVVQFVSLRIDVGLPETTYQRTVVSINREDGRILWQQVCTEQPLALGTIHEANSAATPTPASDGRYVYADFGDAGIYSFDFDGKKIWENKDPAGTMHWGPASSPILWKDLVILTRDTDTESYTVALDKETGDFRWRAERDPEATNEPDGYSTPIIVDIGTGPQLVHYSSHYLAGYDPQTGNELWHVSPEDGGEKQFEMAQQIVPSPVAMQNLIFIAGSCSVPVHIAAIRLEDHNGGIKASVAWSDRRSAPGCSSPVVYGGHVYAVSNNGIASCRRAETGELVGRARLPGSYFSSVTAADGKVYFCNRDGETTVLEAGPALRKLASNPLDEPVSASLAISNGEILIRTHEHLYCISSGG